MAVFSLVLGIISIVFAVLPIGFGYGYYIAMVAGVVGIILAAVAKKKAPSGKATAGLVLSIIGLALSVVFYAACVACVAAATL